MFFVVVSSNFTPYTPNHKTLSTLPNNPLMFIILQKSFFSAKTRLVSFFVILGHQQLYVFFNYFLMNMLVNFTVQIKPCCCCWWCTMYKHVYCKDKFTHSHSLRRLHICHYTLVCIQVMSTCIWKCTLHWSDS